MYVRVCSRRGVGPGSPCMGTRTETDAQSESHGGQRARRCATVFQFASLQGSARHEGEPIKPAMGRRRQGAAATATERRISARLESRRRKGLSAFERDETCQVVDLWRGTKFVKPPSRLPESRLGLPGRLSLPIKWRSTQPTGSTTERPM